MKEVHDFIDNREFTIVFGWISKTTYGMIRWDTGLILINTPLLVAEVFLHEYYHNKYPGASEARIKKFTDNKLKKMCVKEIVALADKVEAEGV